MSDARSIPVLLHGQVIGPAVRTLPSAKGFRMYGVVTLELRPPLSNLLTAKGAGEGVSFWATTTLGIGIVILRRARQISAAHICSLAWRRRLSLSCRVNSILCMRGCIVLPKATLPRKRKDLQPLDGLLQRASAPPTSAGLLTKTRGACFPDWRYTIQTIPRRASRLALNVSGPRNSR